VIRGSVHIRDACPDDVADLVAVWGRSTPEGPETDLDEARGSVARIAADPDQRLLVAVVEDGVAGAVHLTRGPVNPLSADSAVFVMHLQVVEQRRRHGVGRALMEAAVTWAEDKGTAHVLTAAPVASRDANRFMARLGLGQVAVVRGAPVAALRAKLPVGPPAVARLGARSHRSVAQVLVARRSLRRSQAHPS
jgi:GNAT superfamily N-acetyltransferase